MNPNNLPVFEINSRTMDISEFRLGGRNAEFDVTYWGDPPEHERYHFELLLQTNDTFHFDGRVTGIQCPLPDSTRITAVLEGEIEIRRG